MWEGITMITPVRMLGSLSKVSQTRRNVKNDSILTESCTVTCLLRNLFDISCMDVASMCISNSKKVNGRMHISSSSFFMYYLQASSIQNRQAIFPRFGSSKSTFGYVPSWWLKGHCFMNQMQRPVINTSPYIWSGISNATPAINTSLYTWGGICALLCLHRHGK